MQPKDIDPKEAFNALLEDRQQIEGELGFALEWQELPEAKGCRIVTFKQNVDVPAESTWLNQFDWFANHLEKLHDVLGPRIKRL